MREELKNAVLESLGRESASAANIELSNISGGSINNAYKFKVAGEAYFVKVNSAQRYPMMFELENEGLEALRVEGGPFIPKVMSTGYADDDAFLVLEWIQTGKKAHDFWALFAKQLASLHKSTHKFFGWEKDNYIGSLFQSNERLNSWPEFYIINRLDPQVEMAFNNGLLSRQHIMQFNQLYGKLDSLIPHEVPALIHGDLWSGNYLVDEVGKPVLIDPAVYFGHREMDIAMMKLFGGFDDTIFTHYHQNFPLEEGWQERVPLNQLYPLLVHVNLFGQGYVSQLERAIKPFV